MSTFGESFDINYLELQQACAAPSPNFHQANRVLNWLSLQPKSCQRDKSFKRAEA